MIVIERIPATQSNPIPQHEQAILDRARSALRGCAYGCLKRLECTIEDGVLTVRGVLPSFYLKQVVQETLQSDTCPVRNLVAVNWP